LVTQDRFLLQALRIALAMTMTIFALVLAACAEAAPQIPAPPSTVQVVQVVATPVALSSPTPTLTAKATVALVPTPFVTAPLPGGDANVPILMYHHIGDLPIDATELQTTWTVTPKNFDAQMQWLAHNGYRSVTMAQLVAHLKNRQPLPAKPIIISFDDGWEEQYSTAFPILTKYGLSGTFFVYTHPIDHTEYMTWAQLADLTAASMDIESHSITHPHLRDLAPDAAFKEIAESKTTLEKRLGKPVITFCYPFGEYNNAIIEMVKRAGYESAVTLASGYRQRADELYLLHRVRVSYHDSLDDFAKRLP
jgi:peptidoglycan/xylan/chitin deacetylase (PgdA/CDA1 family)